MEEIRLTKEEIEIVEQLLLCIKKSNYSISYKELSENLSFNPDPHFGLNTPLYNIAIFCHKLNLPFITFLVIKKNSKVPGEGFRSFFKGFGISMEKKTTEELYNEEIEKIRNCYEWQRLADALNINIKMPTRGEIIYPDDIPDKTKKEICEGAKKSIVVNFYERNAYARNLCIEHYSQKDGKIKCQICGFDFEEMYGEKYRNLIHVHHIVPISSIGKTYKLDAKKDLIPVCPNCHMVLHSKVGETVEQLKERLNKKRREQK